MKLALMLPNWVGDACMATPTLRALRNQLQGVEEICWIGRPGPLMVLEGLPWADSTICYKPKGKGTGPMGRRALVGELRRRRFDAIVLFTNSLSTAAMAWLGNIPRRIGFARDGRSLLLTDRIPTIDGLKNAHRDPCIDTYLRLASHLGCDTSDRRMELATTETDRELAEQLWGKLQFSSLRPTLLLNTGAATAETKRWPIEHAAQAASTLSRKHGYQVLVHCGPAEREIANRIESVVADPNVRSMGINENLPLGLSKALIERSDVVVSTDSGPRHIAVALNKPVVSLFGPIAPAMTQTYNVPETVVTMGLDCQPCGKYECPLKHTRCMNALDAERVVRAVVAVHAETTRPNRWAS